MKLSTTLLTTSATLTLAHPATVAKRASVQGFDISSYQPTVDFASAYSSGARFVIIKATEGTTYIDSTFSSHYDGATKAGFIRGAYHFAHPDDSSGTTQANYFIENGGNWSGDGSTCYGLSTSSMVSWIQDFVSTYHSKTSRYPLIYSTNDWWTQCTGDSTAFSNNSPLVLARYGSSPGTIPGGWPYETIWQNADSYAYGGDADEFNGSEDGLKKLATG